MILQPGQFATYSLRHSIYGDVICQVLAACINSANAHQAVSEHVNLENHLLHVDHNAYDLRKYERVFVISIGKAAIPMATAIWEVLGKRIEDSLVITKKDSIVPENGFFNTPFPIYKASHPIPDVTNLDASEKLSSLIHRLTHNDLVICLLSGGGSALLIKPIQGISLEDLQITTQLLLASGAEIGEINTIRKHLDEYKGGRLAQLIFPATLITLVISDVVGDHLDQIASGPTAADPTTYKDAWAILEKYQLLGQVPQPVFFMIEEGMAGKLPETLKHGDQTLDCVQNIIIGSNAQAANNALRKAHALGFTTKLITTELRGEASQVGRLLTAKVQMLLKTDLNQVRPVCLIAGGETTVTVRGNGKGGRNQELALGAVEALSGDEPIVLVSLASDGEDGFTDAAGAVTTNNTYQRGVSMGLHPQVFLQNNDSYTYFDKLNDLIKTGLTLTNVNDLVFFFAF